MSRIDFNFEFRESIDEVERGVILQELFEDMVVSDARLSHSIDGGSIRGFVDDVDRKNINEVRYSLEKYTDNHPSIYRGSYIEQ